MKMDKYFEVTIKSKNKYDLEVIWKSAKIESKYKPLDFEFGSIIEKAPLSYPHLTIDAQTKVTLSTDIAAWIMDYIGLENQDKFNDILDQIEPVIMDHFLDEEGQNKHNWSLSK